MWNPFLESTLIKSYSIQNLLRCHCGQTSLCEVAANLTSSDTMIVFEVGVGLACGATRRCSWGVEFAAASRDTHRFSAQGRVLSTVPSGRRYVSLAAGTCHRFPVKWMEEHQTDIFVHFHHKQEESTNLILKSSGLLLEPCCFEVIYDVSDPPVGRVRQLAVLHWAVQWQWMHSS